MQFARNSHNGIIVIIIITMIPFLFGCKNNIEMSSIPDIMDNPSMSATDLDLYQSQYGKQTLRIIAKTVNIYSFQEEPTTEFPDGIVVEFFDENNNISSYLSANSAVYYETKDRWEAFGDIEAKNVEGTIFNTEYIEWSQETGEIRSDKFIKITDKDGVVYGRGFRSKQDFTDWTVLNPTGDFLIDQKEFTSEN